MPSSTTLTRLFEALTSSAGPVPALDLNALSDLSTEDAASLAKIWSNIPVHVRRPLVEDLGELANDHIEYDFEVVNRLALADEDPGIRSRAIANLWECEDDNLAEALMRIAADDPDSDVRAAATASLARFVYLGEVEKIKGDLLRTIEDMLISLASQTTQPEIRRRAIESLGYSSRSEVPSLIAGAYETDEESERLASVVAMGRSAHDRWLPEVMAELNSHSPHIRAEAARAAGELESRKAVAALVELLEDAHPSVRRAAIWSLGQLGGDQARAALEHLTESGQATEDLALIEDALDYLGFLESTPEFLLMDLDGPDEEP